MDPKEREEDKDEDDQRFKRWLDECEEQGHIIPHNEICYHLIGMIDSYLPMVSEIMTFAPSLLTSTHFGSAEEQFRTKFDRYWWDSHHDPRVCTQTIPCEADLDPRPVTHLWNNRMYLFHTYTTLSSAEDGHDPLTSLFCKAMPQKHTLDEFPNKLNDIFSVREKRKTRQGCAATVVTTGLSVLLNCLEWWCMFNLGMYRHSSHQLNTYWDLRTQWIKFWNDLHHPDAATSEWLMNQAKVLIHNPLRTLFCIKEYIIYAVRVMPAFRDWVRERSIWDAYEYQCIQVLNRFRRGRYKDEEVAAYLACMCKVGYHTRQPMNFYGYMGEFLSEPKPSALLEWTEIKPEAALPASASGLSSEDRVLNDEDGTDEQEEDEDENEGEPDPTGNSLASLARLAKAHKNNPAATAAVVRKELNHPELYDDDEDDNDDKESEAKKLEMEDAVAKEKDKKTKNKRKRKPPPPKAPPSLNHYFMSIKPNASGDARKKVRIVPKDVDPYWIGVMVAPTGNKGRYLVSEYKAAAQELLDKQYLIADYQPVEEELRFLEPIQPHSYRPYLTCRRIIQVLFASYGGTMYGTGLCLDLCHAYFLKRCGKTAVGHLMSQLTSKAPYEYNLLYYLVSAWQEWNNVWSVKRSAWFAYNQRSAFIDRFKGITPHHRAEWLVYCPNCLDIQSLIVQSRGTAASFPSQYDSKKVSGFKNVLLCLQTQEFYCGRKSGQRAKRCADTKLAHMNMFGRICNLNGESYCLCEQPACANIIEMNSAEDYYNEYGIVCAHCVRRYTTDELKEKKLWNREEEKKWKNQPGYQPRPFPYLHWSVLRDASQYERKKKRGRPSTKNKSLACSSSAEAASLGLANGSDLTAAAAALNSVTDEELFEDPSFVHEEDTRLNQMNDIQRIADRHTKKIQAEENKEHADKMEARRNKRRKPNVNDKTSSSVVDAS